MNLFGKDWVPLIAELSPAIKIASGDLTSEPVSIGAAIADVTYGDRRLKCL